MYLKFAWYCNVEEKAFKNTNSKRRLSIPLYLGIGNTCSKLELFTKLFLELFKTWFTEPKIFIPKPISLDI